MHVEVFEAETQPGGAARTMELTAPGFLNDFGSSVYPMGAGSPFFRSLPLKELGLEWVYGDACIAHPMDDGTAVFLENSLDAQEQQLGPDGKRWVELMGPFAERWWDLAEDVLRPPIHLPKHPLLMARFGMYGVQPAALLARTFRTERAKALLGGIVGHSLLSFDQVMSSAVGIILGAT